MTKDHPERPATVASRGKLGDLDVDAHLSDPARKQAFVTPMFDIIAPRYDAFTRLFSFGMDSSWKREAIAAIGKSATGTRTALDLASGTGDIAIAIARAVPAAHVTALDASPRMVDAANTRLAHNDHEVSTRVTTVPLSDVMG